MLRSLWVFAVALLLAAAILVVQGSRDGAQVAQAHALGVPKLEPTKLGIVAPQSIPAAIDPSTSNRDRRPTLADARRILRWRHVLLVPKSCGTTGGYDLILHFHGVADTMDPIFRDSALDAVVVITNLGLASGPYEKLFTGRTSFQSYLDQITSELRAYCHDATPRRVALSSWSAGYGATLRILEYEQNRERIDAVLLADGLHGGLERRHPRIVRAAALEPVNQFAAQAARGQRLLAITHSSILTSSYASTTETAGFLLDAQGVEREQVDLPGPRPSMRLTSTARRADLSVDGYLGNNADAHCDHLYAFGKTLLPKLEARWNH